MATATQPHFIPIERYLNTTYRPDVDYTDAEIEERNLGEFDHGDLQSAVSAFLRDKQEACRSALSSRRASRSPPPASASRTSA